jgi:hypothetical protein
MALSRADLLRLRLAEQIPDGGSDADTLFTDEEIAEFLSETGGNLDAAAMRGWQAKAGKLAELSDVIEGNSTRKLSDLHEHALAQVKMYRDSLQGISAGRVRVGKIVRP